MIGAGKCKLNRFCRRLTPIALLCSVSGARALAVDAPLSQDKSDYNLFHRTPVSLMRDMNTDRPDKTESPYTVDAGHYQIESDLFTYTHDRVTTSGDNITVDSWSLGTVNFKVGLYSWADIQFVVDPFNQVHISDSVKHTVTTHSGFGDLTVRFKANLWGNDGGTTAFGVMPFVKIPSNQDGLGNHAVEGGFILPLAVSLPGGWDLGAMTELDLNQNSDNNGYHADFVNSITVGHEIIGRLSGYVEFFSDVSTERDTEWVGTFDVGLNYKLTDNIQLDAGVNLGITDAADDVDPFLGVSVRF
ncbi:MAG TPA: transporter [Dongiaceae bacterium]|nr:transporter [Dongiaceae bacterium]